MIRIMSREKNGEIVLTCGSPKNIIEKIKGKKLTDEEYYDVIRSDIPGDHTIEAEFIGDEFPEGGVDFQQAWEASDGKVSVNMDKAREEWRGKIRKYRAGRFKELDLEEFSADRRQDTEATGRIAVVKQRLRDAPADQRIDAAKTPDELKKIWIDELGAE